MKNVQGIAEFQHFLRIIGVGGSLAGKAFIITFSSYVGNQFIFQTYKNFYLGSNVPCTEHYRLCDKPLTQYVHMHHEASISHCYHTEIKIFCCSVTLQCIWQRQTFVELPSTNPCSPNTCTNILTAT